MKAKKFLMIALIIVVCIVLVACGKNNSYHP